MHAARIESSPRLQRVHALLADGAERTTFEIVAGAQVTDCDFVTNTQILWPGRTN